MRIIRIAQADWDVKLECICADDFGTGYKDESNWTDEDRQDAERYEATRDAHQRLEVLAKERGIRHYIADTDDRDSRHSDAYLYFPWSKVDEVAALLKESGVDGDILDIPSGFPVEFEAKAEELGWTIERH